MLKFNLQALTDAFGMEEQDVISYFNDGRKASFIIENRLVRDYTGGKRSDSEGSGWDIEDRNGNKWEVRSLTNSGVYFCPSSMVGSGRKFDEDGFLAKLDNVSGYLITDITQFPNVPVYRVSSEQVKGWYAENKLGAGTKVSYKNAIDKLNKIGAERLPHPPVGFRDIANAE